MSQSLQQHLDVLLTNQYFKQNVNEIGKDVTCGKRGKCLKDGKRGKRCDGRQAREKM